MELVDSVIVKRPSDHHGSAEFRHSFCEWVRRAFEL